MSFTGPYDAYGATDTPSRRSVLGSNSAPQTEAEAEELLRKLAERAWRGPVGDQEFASVAKLYREGLREGGVEAGMEMGLAGILVSPRFLFRIERDPPGTAVGTTYAVSDVELATRLSFFFVE